MENRQQVTAAAEQRAPEKKTIGLTTFVTIVSIVGTVLILLGQGVAMAVEAAIPIPHHLLVSSPFDLIELSIWVITEGFAGWERIPMTPLYLAMLAKLALLIFSAWALVLIIYFSRHKLRALWESHLVRAIRAANPQPSRKDGARMLIVKTGGLTAGLTAALSLVPVALILLIMTAMSFMALLPLIGFDAGKAYIVGNVLRPKRCAPLLTREQILAANKNGAKVEQYAQCVAISNDRRRLGRGRVVLTTSSAMILFDPDTGQSWRVPTKDTLVEIVDTLSPNASPVSKGALLTEPQAPSALIPMREPALRGTK
jgi:hypothetical protein